MEINDSFESVSSLIRTCLTSLYTEDRFLFKRNRGEGVCERALVFRFAYYLQSMLEGTIFKVDCDFDSSFMAYKDHDGVTQYTELVKKKISLPNGKWVDIYPDIIVHTRNFESWNDFICFEFKRKKYDYGKEKSEDLYKLGKLTSEFGYRWGFYIVLGLKQEDTKWTVFEKIEENTSKQKIKEQAIF